MKDSFVDYELGIHDCGLNPNCNRYRSCGNDTKPLPSLKDIRKLKVLFKRQLIKDGHHSRFINQYLKEKWK